METPTGRFLTLPDVKADQICIEDIAESLGKQCRYVGHCIPFYSVGEHSILMSDMFGLQNFRLALLALMHDAHEYITGDIQPFVKKLFPGIRDLENHFQMLIYGALDIEPPTETEARLVKSVDIAIKFTEIRQISKSGGAAWPNFDESKVLDIKINGLDPGRVKRDFLERWDTLIKAKETYFESNEVV